MKRFSAYTQSQHQERQASIALLEKAKAAARTYRRMTAESEEMTDVAKSEVANRAATISAEALGKKLLLLRRKRLNSTSKFFG